MTPLGGSLDGLGGLGFGSLTAAPIPEPGSLALLGIGVLAVIATHRRRKSKLSLL